MRIYPRLVMFGLVVWVILCSMRPPDAGSYLWTTIDRVEHYLYHQKTPRYVPPPEAIPDAPLPAVSH